MDVSKVTSKRRTVTCDVTGKKIKIPKELRSEIKSYRRVGFGPNERDVLVGEIINNKYLVFPLQKEMDLENSEIYIVERDPRDKSDNEDSKSIDIESKETSDGSISDDNKYYLVNVDGLDIKYRIVGISRIGELTDKSLFIYDDEIWVMHRTAGRRFINSVNNVVSFPEYYKQKYKVNNPYCSLYSKIVKTIEIVSE